MQGFPVVNMNDVAIQAMDPVDIYIEKEEKPVDKTIWKEGYQLINFTLPDVADFSNMYKQFKIHVDCVDKTTRTTFGKTIFFGQDDDYIWTHDKAERLKRLNSFSNKDNPLHADYWRTQLCFYSPDFKQNVNRMVNFLLEKRLKRLQTLKPKKDFSPIVAKRKAARLQKK